MDELISCIKRSLPKINHRSDDEMTWKFQSSMFPEENLVFDFI